MKPRRVSLLVGLLCLIASTSLAAAPPKPIEGVISGVEVCPQSWCSNGALFTGTFAGKVNGSYTIGVFLVQVSHGDLAAQTSVTGGSWIIRTRRGDFAGTITNGMLTANNDATFNVILTLEMTQPASATLLFTGVLDHSGLDKEIPEPPTITGDIS